MALRDESTLAALSLSALTITLICLFFFPALLFATMMLFDNPGSKAFAHALAVPIWVMPGLVPLLIVLAWTLRICRLKRTAVVVAIGANYPIIWPGAIVWLPWVARLLR